MATITNMTVNPLNVSYQGSLYEAQGSCCHCSFEDTPYLSTTCGNLATFMILLQSLMSARCDIADPCRRIGKDQLPEDEQYDFIIVGAGVAGPIIARRLSDNPSWKVLLVEAGPEEPTMTAIPGIAFDAENSSVDWKFLTEPTEPQPTACLETEGVCSWPRGKMVSGTGGMYGMMYVRGHPEVYNQWSEDGNYGWAYDDIEHYFQKAESPSENVTVMNPGSVSSRKDGPVKLEYFPYQPEFASVILTAATERGYGSAHYNGINQTGFMLAPMMTVSGLRGTTSRFYLRPVSHRENLQVLTNAHVAKILISNCSFMAEGIEYVDRNGEKKVVKADKEVILTAGAIGSPQILMHSGVGPKADLTELGIETIKDLAVGKNLHNHVSVGIKMTINDTYYDALTLDAVNEYLQNRTGPMSSTGITQITAFLESSYTTVGIPDLQVFFDGFSSSCSRTGVSTECPDGSLGTCPERRDIVARPTVVVPRTRGVLKLRSTDPLDLPLIYPNYFDTATDMKILIEGIEQITKLPETEAMKRWDLQLNTTSHPSCTSYDFGTDAYWECYIRETTGPENHQAGTCKMGPATDPDSVVDPQLRVRGITNIRVADASIFPQVPNCNPSAGIIMVAEKAADLIRDTWSYK